MGSRVGALLSPDRFPVMTRGHTRSPKKAVGIAHGTVDADWAAGQRAHIGLALPRHHALERVAEELIIVRKSQAWSKNETFTAPGRGWFVGQ